MLLQSDCCIANNLYFGSVSEIVFLLYRPKAVKIFALIVMDDGFEIL